MPLITSSFEDSKYAAYGLPNGTFSNLTLELCSPRGSLSPQYSEKFPLVLFSGALGTSRYLYSAIAATVSTIGYTVVTVDHPYDTDIVEFPSGDIVLGLNLSDAQIPLAVETRVQDLRFVLDQLQSLHSCRAGAFAHSLGGAAVIGILDIDPRIVGGINLDGSVFDPADQTDTNKPVVLFGHDGKNQSTDSTWAELWPHLKGWKKELELLGSAHYTFSDFPLIADKLGGVSMLPEVVKSLIGDLEGQRVMDILGSYVGSFLDMVLKGGSGSLFNGNSTKYPEVVVIE